MTAAYFEDHPTDPEKVILRKPKHEKVWVELTDEEIEMIYAVTIKIRKKDIMPGEQKMFAKTIEQFLKERNT